MNVSKDIPTLPIGENMEWQAKVAFFVFLSIVAICVAVVNIFMIIWNVY